MSADNIQLLLVVLAVFIAPLALGQYIGRVTRMPEQSWRVAMVLFSFFAAAAITWYGWPPKLGIDLSGGSILVYEIDESQKDRDTTVDMTKLINAVTQRVNPGGVKEVTIRPYGHNQIEIIIPQADEAEIERIKTKISKTGMLEFRITANTRDHANIIDMAQRLDPADKVLTADNSEGGRDTIARWVPVRRDDTQHFSNSDYIARANDKGELEVLTVMDDENVTGQYLKSASPSHGVQGAEVDFVFNNMGSRLFGRMTSNNLPDTLQNFYRHLGIILDGYLYSAPRIITTIDDRGQITGLKDQTEADDLAAVLNAGSLPTALRKEPSSSLVTGATLGADTITKGVYSMLIATVAVIVFMIIYYRFAGMVANIALLLNVLLIVAFMIMFNAAFTLSGLAGLALTVGMAVDANVLIYERMREELARKATLRMAIRNGFERATTTIIDANVTTLISAVVLYIMGSDQVKGFAVTLILGIVMNLFTAIFVSRVFFDIAEKTRFITDMKMLHILSNPHFDFIGKRKIAIVASAVVIALGLFGVVKRGKGLLDIDFTGGVSVQVEFAEPENVGDVRAAIAAVRDKLPDTTVQDVRITGQEPGTQFVINTSNEDPEVVEETLAQVFQGKLKFNKLTYSVAAISPTDKRSESEGSEAEKPADAESAPADKPPKDSSSRAAPHRAKDELLLALADAPAIGGEDAPAKGSEEAASIEASPAGATPSDTGATATEGKPAGVPAPGEAGSRATAGPALPSAPRTGLPGAATSGAPLSESAIAAAGRFAGGSQAKLEFTAKISHDALKDLLDEAIEKRKLDSSVVAYTLSAPGYEAGSNVRYNTWNIRTSLPPPEAEQLLGEVQGMLASRPSFPASSTIGAAVASATQQQAVMAMIAALVLILAYMWFRFSQVMFGVAGVLAVVHDVLVTLGALALSLWLADYLGFLLVEPFKISLPIIAAFLTIIGYSLNDTIVIFDRIREVRGKSPIITAQLANDCINQTLSRTILTSLTVFIVVLILYVVGGEGIHAFAFALVVGVLAGTYSTVYIATPIVLWMNHPEEASRGSRQASTSESKRERISPA